MKISDFRILSGWIEKYKPALSKSDSSWDNSYCVRLVIVLLAVNIGKLQSLVSEDKKSTYTGLLLNSKSFISFSYKISLIKCLIDKSFKICNNWNSIHNDIKSIKSNLIKNAYLPLLINKTMKKYLDYKLPSNQNQLKDKSDV